MLDRVEKMPPRTGLQWAGRAKLIADPGNLSSILSVLRLRRRTILAATALGFALALAYLLIAIPQFRATASILIDFRRLAVIGQDQYAINYKVNDSAVDSQRVIIGSPEIAARVVRQLSLDKDDELNEPASLFARLANAFWPFGDNPVGAAAGFNRVVENLNERLSAERVGVSYVVEVSFLSRDAAKATRIANAVSAAYVQDQLAAKLDAAGTANDWFQKRVKILDDQANQAEREAVEYRTNNRIMLVDGKFVDEQQVSELSSQLVTARSDRAQAGAKIAQVQAILKTGAASAVADEFKNNLVVALRQKRAEIARRIAEAITRVGAGHESVQHLQGDLNETDGAINAELRRIADGYRSDATVATLREASLQKQLADVAERSAQDQQARVRLTQLQSTAQTLKTMRDTFASRYIEASQEQSFPITEARVVSPAVQPDKPALPKVARVLGGGLVVGSGFGCMLALMGEILTRRTRTRQQVESLIGAPCVAVVGQFSRAEMGDAVFDLAALQPNGPLAEAMRSVRFAIDSRFPGQAEDPGTVVAFASPSPGDGTTTIATNFAALLAQRGVPVLLIDLDLRWRSHHHTLADHAGREPDLLDVLSGRAPLEAAIRRRPLSGADVLFAGHVDDMADPSAWLASATLVDLIATARARYRYVVLDLPPIISVGDGRAVSGLIDAFLLVLAWNVTTLEELAEATALNPELCAKLVGGILNKADPSAMAQMDDLSLSRTVSYLMPATVAR